MIIFPAIDLLGGKAVRLLRGDYERSTVYGDDPAAVAAVFAKLGATHIHIVDLDGAKSGETPNFDCVLKIKERSGLFCEIGGGVRSLDTVKKYLSSGMDRVILGTAALEDRAFLQKALDLYGEAIAVGADIREGMIAVRGWTERTDLSIDRFALQMQKIGVRTLICTDISKDGAMSGANLTLYERLSKNYGFDLTASGGVSSLNDIRALRKMNIYGAIVGKAYYEGALDLKEAIEVAK